MHVITCLLVTFVAHVAISPIAVQADGAKSQPLSRAISTLPQAVPPGYGTRGVRGERRELTECQKCCDDYCKQKTTSTACEGDMFSGSAECKARGIQAENGDDCGCWCIWGYDGDQSKCPQDGQGNPDCTGRPDYDTNGECHDLGAALDDAATAVATGIGVVLIVIIVVVVVVIILSIVACYFCCCRKQQQQVIVQQQAPAAGGVQTATVPMAQPV